MTSTVTGTDKPELTGPGLLKFKFGFSKLCSATFVSSRKVNVLDFIQRLRGMTVTAAFRLGTRAGGKAEVPIRNA